MRQRRIRAVFVRMVVLIAAVLGTIFVLGVMWGVILAVLSLTLLVARRRKLTRDLSAMDHDVQERIRAIAAESRYSSAGIEF